MLCSGGLLAPAVCLIEPEPFKFTLYCLLHSFPAMARSSSFPVYVVIFVFFEVRNAVVIPTH